MVFYGVTGLKSQELGYLLFHYLNLENAHILCIVFTEDFQTNYHYLRAHNALTLFSNLLTYNVVMETVINEAIKT
jgi:hypothetical protein